MTRETIIEELTQIFRDLFDNDKITLFDEITKCRKISRLSTKET